MTSCTCSLPAALRFSTLSLAKSCLVSALLISCAFTRASAAVAIPASPCTLGWNRSPDSSVAGYAIYYGIAGSITNRQDVGMMNNVTLYNLLMSSNYFFYVVAYNAGGIEGPRSSVLNYKPPGLSRLKLSSRVRGIIGLQFRAAPGSGCLIQYSPTLNPPQWRVLGTGTADAYGNISVTDATAGSAASRFYRAVLYSSPQVLSAINVISPAAGTVNLQFQTRPGAICLVQYTPSLNPPQWQTLASVTAGANGNVSVSDQPPANTPSRFYRAVVR